MNKTPNKAFVSDKIQPQASPMIQPQTASSSNNKTGNYYEEFNINDNLSYISLDGVEQSEFPYYNQQQDEEKEKQVQYEKGLVKNFNDPPSVGADFIQQFTQEDMLRIVQMEKFEDSLSQSHQQQLQPYQLYQEHNLIQQDKHFLNPPLNRNGFNYVQDIAFINQFSKIKRIDNCLDPTRLKEQVLGQISDVKKHQILQQQQQQLGYSRKIKSKQEQKQKKNERKFNNGDFCVQLSNDAAKVSSTSLHILKKRTLQDATLKQEQSQVEINNNQQITLIGKHACPIENCNKQYSRHFSLKKHMEQEHHKTAKKYPCTEEDCKKFYYDKTSLENHLNKHRGIKPYKCEECFEETRFTTLGHLKDHQRSFHTKEKPFVCTFEGCDQRFSRKNILKVHLRVHTKERPYICTECSKGFTESGNLKQHLKIHGQVKDFLCPFDQCTQAFSTKSILKAHLKSKIHQKELTLLPKTVLDEYKLLDFQKSNSDLQVFSQNQSLNDKLERLDLEEAKQALSNTSLNNFGTKYQRKHSKSNNIDEFLFELNQVIQNSDSSNQNSKSFSVSNEESVIYEEEYEGKLNNCINLSFDKIQIPHKINHQRN